MFRNKHVYTCPDSIHDHRVAKRNGRIILAIYAALGLGTWLYGKKLEKQMDAELQEIIESDPVK